ncbi:MAG: hypothetical protein GY756_02185 [bacterium]|nr:hypothetical protein [bacterium]
MTKIKKYNLLIWPSLITLLLLTACSRMPSDRKMIANFNEHKVVFEKLVKMIKHDKGVSSIYIDKNNKNNIKNISGQRLNKYQKMLQNIGVSSIGIDNEHKYIYLGYYDSGSLKRYVYAEGSKPHPMFKSLDNNIDSQLKKENKHQAFRHITGNWYIQYSK